MVTPPLAGDVDHHYAGVFIVTESGKIIGQRRDNKPTIDNPGKIGTFGGGVEKGENPRQAAWRELTQEETNLHVELDAIELLFEDVAWREFTKEWEARHFFVTRISDSMLADMEVYEGEGWVYIESHEDPDLIELWRPAIKKAIEAI
ncbi:MAG TPA: NUDIX domain-containing protein [Patescibacteria group bacterium]|nr:NUDIX domain-containing protein [Patescibacteria group bacterium]